MAFYNCVNRTVSTHSLRTIAHKVILGPTFYFSKYLPNDQDEKESVLDDFTSQLMQQKSLKWENRKVLAQKKKVNKPLSKVMSRTGIVPSAKTDISLLNIDEITMVFQRAIDIDDILTIIELTKQCVKYDKVPSLLILLRALSVCSQNGEKDLIVEIVQLCEKIRPEILQENSHFEHYLAEAIWIKGNITKSLEIFERVYRENIFLRRTIRSILKYLILDVVSNHSEVTLLNIIKFSEMLVKEYRDFFPLGCIWQSCFLSEWFTDQQLALELLERNYGLCNAIVGRIPFVVRISLKFDRTEVVYRLTEMLLKFDLESELVHVLLALIDYWIKQGDLRRCIEVLKWSVQNDIPLPTITKNTKLMELLKDESEIKPQSEPSLQHRPPTEYKF